MRLRASSRSAKFEGCQMDIVETGAALAGCLLVLAVAIVLDRRLYRRGSRITFR
jgi:hypothetical protein